MTRQSIVNGKRYDDYVIQDGVVKIQAAPVQNTWYTVMDTTPNVRLYIITLRVADTGEDLELRITVDGEVYTAVVAAVAGTTYYCYIGAGNWMNYAGTHINVMGYDSLVARSAKIEFRKTSAAGAGTITSMVEWGKKEG